MHTGTSARSTPRPANPGALVSDTLMVCWNQLNASGEFGFRPGLSRVCLEQVDELEIQQGFGKT